jgi:hypothetical protein
VIAALALGLMVAAPALFDGGGLLSASSNSATPSPAAWWSHLTGGHHRRAARAHHRSTTPATATSGSSAAAPSSSAAPSPAGTASSTPAASTASPSPAGNGLSTLPFDIPSRATLAASKKQVVAYYHTLPLYRSNNDAGYAGNLSPSGNGGAYRSVGGKWRQRPYPVVSDANLTDARRTQYMYQDISEAAAIGIDAFFFNVTYLPTDARWSSQLLPMYAAADQFNAQNQPGFKVAIDLSALAINGRPAAEQSPERWADNLAPILQRPSYYHYAGKPAVAVYNVTQLAPSWYQAFANRLKTAHGLDIYLLPSFQGNQPTQLDPYAGLMPSLMPTIHGWTGTGPNVAPGAVQQTLRTWAAAHKVTFMGSAGPFEDDRPVRQKELEGAGFTILRNMWLASIQHNDDSLQIVTWNDEEESSAIRPSTGYQYAPYDVTAYYLTWFKTGAAPPIVRDTLYYAHRMQQLKAPYDRGQQAKPFVFANTTSSPPTDSVYTMAFLKAPADVDVVTGGTTHTHSNVPAGVTILSDPLAVNDQPSFSAVRNGTAVVPRFTSPFRTRASVVWQDLLYRMGSSSRPVIPDVQNNLPQDR